MRSILFSRYSIVTVWTALFLLYVPRIFSQQSPYHDSPFSIPCLIEAEDFDSGGQGVAYYDIDETNNGSQYRPSEAVDIESVAGGGYNVGWIMQGEWMEYTVDVQHAGLYTLEIQLASDNSGSHLHLEIDNVDITGSMSFPLTGGWQNWRTETLNGIELPAGKHVLKFEADESGFNLDWMRFISEKELIYPEVSLTEPADKSNYYRGDDIAIAADASDSDGYIVRVEFYADEMMLGQKTAAPYQMVWEDASIGKWDLTAVAVDNDGARTTSEKVDITVKYPVFLNELEFSQDRGFYENPFDLSISTPIPGAEIRYTLNGSDPWTASDANAGISPVTLSVNPDSRTDRGKTPGVVVRAVAVLNGEQASKIETYSYIFVNKVASQADPGGAWPDPGVNGQQWHYGVNTQVTQNSRYRDLMDDAMLDISTVSMVTDLDHLFGAESGIYVNAEYHGGEWERPASIELIHPDAAEGFQINAGVRIRGGWSRHDNYPKHAFRLFFREEYGQSALKYPLFGEEGVDEFKKMDLRTSQNYAWSNGYVEHNTMNRDVFSRDLQREMGQPYTRSRYYHLYINGLYWGLFQSQERPEAYFGESYLGGDRDDYDVVKVDIGEDFDLYEIEVTDGYLDGWETVWQKCQTGFRSDANYFALEGRTESGSIQPAGQRLVDIDNLIDYMIIIYYTGNFDAPVTKFRGNVFPNNFYAIYNRNDNDGFQFFAHDCEHTLLLDDMRPGVGIHEDRVNIAEDDERPMYVGEFRYFHPQWLHHRLSENEEYRMRFADHVYKHFYNEGVCTEKKLISLFEQRVDELDLAIIAESARWGDMTRSKHNAWQPKVNQIIADYFPERGSFVIGQLQEADLYPDIEPPEFRHNGNPITESQIRMTDTWSLELDNPNGSRGTLYFTTDGNDPRNVGGTLYAAAVNAGDSRTIEIKSTTKIKARVRNGSEWSALHELLITDNQSLSSLVITEIHYHPLDEGSVSGREFEFVELYNRSDASLDLSLAVFIDGIDYEFPPGTILNSSEILVIASNQIQFEKRYNRVPFGEFEGQLDNGGERLLLAEADGDTIVNIRYNDKAPWPVAPDTAGYSLVYKTDALNQNDALNWRSSAQIHGSPGEIDSASEVCSSPEPAPRSFTLLHNYPNPFNPSTTIAYSLSEQGPVTIAVYDVLGNRVAMLLESQVHAAGLFHLHWPGKDDAGRNVSSGVYFVRMKSKHSMQTRKMMLIR